jgi:predicted ester cyclase
MTEQERNKEVVRHYVEAFNRLDIPALRGLFAPEAVVYGVLGSGGMDVAIPIWTQLHESLGLKLEVQALAAEGDSVAARYIERGSFRGPFLGHQPTGKSFELVAMEWFILREGRITARWGARDSAAMARQMGMPPG